MSKAMPDLLLCAGMHRSGTSLLGKRLDALGYHFPGELLAPNDDNPEGYWETRSIVQFNNGLLRSLGIDWRSCAPISQAQMSSLVDVHAEEAADLLASLVAGSPTDRLALKDPRFCRLLPVWSRAADFAGIRVRVLGTCRPQQEVARSLFRRLRDDRFKPAAIGNPVAACLVWSRYMLDLERHSRSLTRAFLSFQRLKALSDEALRTLAEDPGHPTRGCEPYPAPLSSPVSLRAFADDLAGMLTASNVDDLAARFDSLGTLFCDFTHQTQPGLPSLLDGPGLAEVAARFDREGEPGAPRIAFISGSPGSKGEIYRVENRIEALIGTDWIPFRAEIDTDPPESIVENADLIIVFRASMTGWLDEVYQQARKMQVPLVFDIDDLLFDPEIISPDYVRFLSDLPAPEFASWKLKSDGLRQALERADMVWTPTETLCAEAKKFNRNVACLSNGLSEDRIRYAGQLTKCRDLTDQETVVVGYASGTPTHDYDFATIAPALLEVMQAHPNTRLCIVGHLSPLALAELAPVAARIDHRPLVAFRDLPGALSQFDINIAPLELENRFCQSKSELKFFEAALVKVPSIVSATDPFSLAIRSGEDGYTARNLSDWCNHLTHLVSDVSAREHMGRSAYNRAIDLYGPHRQALDFVHSAKSVLNSPNTKGKIS
jgi:glycosyltransferase involved in cell wall biosynthesis